MARSRYNSIIEGVVLAALANAFTALPLSTHATARAHH